MLTKQTVFFIVFTVTVLLPGQFEVETTTSFQRCINVDTTTFFQPSFDLISMLKPPCCFNVEITMSVQLSYFNHVSTLMCDRFTTLLCLLGSLNMKGREFLVLIK